MDIYSNLQQIFQNSPITIIECGGHRGSDTQKLATMFPNAVIHTLEANPQLYTKYLQPLSLNPNIRVYNIGLAASNTQLPFFIDCNQEGDSGASSLLHATSGYLKDYIKEEKEILVPCTTLEKFMTINEIKKVDLLWLDIEGFEYYVLETLKPKNCQVAYVYTEVNFNKFRVGGKLYADIVELMTNLGFVEIAQWTQGGEWGTWQGNVLFKNIEK